MKGRLLDNYTRDHSRFDTGIHRISPGFPSGHLVLAQKLFGLSEDLLTFDILVHFGTLLAIVTVFYRLIATITVGTISGMHSIVSGRTSLVHAYRNSQDFRMVTAIIAGTIPAVVVGLTLEGAIEALFNSAAPVLIALAITGIILTATFFARKGDNRVDLIRGFIIGVAQAIAVIPGISRSGSTIATGLFLKVERREAGEFSFLLAIPAISGATLLAVKDLSAGLANLSVSVITAGVAASFISGYVSLILLMKIVRKGKIGYFGFYCLAISILGMFFLVLR